MVKLPEKYELNAWFENPYWINPNEPLAEWVDTSNEEEVHNFRLLGAWKRWKQGREDFLFRMKKDGIEIDGF